MHTHVIVYHTCSGTADQMWSKIRGMIINWPKVEIYK